MFGLTFEKLFVIGLVAAFLIGPQRLPLYAARLARLVRAARDVAAAARLRAEAELGTELGPDQWRRLDVRQYDPRRIVRDALREEDPPRVDPPAAAREEGPFRDDPPAAAREVAAEVAVGSEDGPVVAIDGRPASTPAAGADRSTAPAVLPPVPAARPRAGSDGRYRRPRGTQRVAEPADLPDIPALAS